MNNISGISLSEDNFRMEETDKFIDINNILNVLDGNLAIYRVTNYLPENTCDVITKNFFNSSKKTPRYGYGKDGVEGYFVGSSHIDKTTTEYLDESDYFKIAVNELYNNAFDPIFSIKQEITRNNNRNISVRLARLNNRFSGEAKAIYWNNDGDFLLEPHDDLAQTKDPKQHDFEIQHVKLVMAVNLYVEVPVNFGQLKIWNIQPSNESRDKLGLTYSGYPYPSNLLEEFTNMVVPVKTGDLCFLNGNLIHAVLGKKAALRDRLLISFFSGLNDDNELICWT